MDSSLLIDGLSFGFTHRFLGGTELLRYWIAPNTPAALARQLEQRLLQLDARLDLDFQRVANRADAQLEVVATSGRNAVDPVTGRPTQVVGSADPGDDRWRLEWASNAGSPLETIVHELGHVLGLGHPNRSDGFDPAFNTAHTVMSYNRNAAAPGRMFTAADLAALTALWQPENDAASEQHSWAASPEQWGANTSLAADLQLALAIGENASFVERAYQLGLGRGVDAAGLEFWQQQLNTGTSRLEFISALLLSEEASQLLAGAA